MKSNKSVIFNNERKMYKTKEGIKYFFFTVLPWTAVTVGNIAMILFFLFWNA